MKRLLTELPMRHKHQIYLLLDIITNRLEAMKEINIPNYSNLEFIQEENKTQKIYLRNTNSQLSM